MKKLVTLEKNTLYLVFKGFKLLLETLISSVIFRRFISTKISSHLHNKVKVKVYIICIFSHLILIYEIYEGGGGETSNMNLITK